MVVNLGKHCGVHKKGELQLGDVLNAVRQRRDFSKVGAMAMFVGVVRGETAKGEVVKGLELEAYEEKADEVLEKICRELKARKGVVDVQVHHFTGKFELGEDLVYVVVAGGGRPDVFPAFPEAGGRHKPKGAHL